MAGELTALLEDYYRRRALGESLGPDAFRKRAGAHFEAFRRLVDADTLPVKPPAVPPSFPFTFGGYLVLHEIGRGGAGVVYEALQRETGRRVALKVLRLWHLGDKRILERFRREAQLCARVRHDNIVEILDADDVCGRPYFAMELVEGKTLDELVKAHDAPPPREMAVAMASIADAVEHLHREGIIHRDLKPTNIMFRPDGRPVLTDFGVAHDAEASVLTKTGDALGTPAFMSPEQLLGRRDDIDARTDVYGLGATLYFGLTGKTIVAHHDRAAMTRAILAAKPPSARAQNRAVPRAIARATQRALAKRRAHRPQTAAAFRDALRRAATGQPPKRWQIAVPLILAAAVVGLAWPRDRAPDVTFAEFKTGPPPGLVRSGQAVDPCLPRGDVTVAELDAVTIRVDPSVDGRLVFRVEDETIYSEPFDPTNTWSRVPIPAAVRDVVAKRPGATVTWGLAADDGSEHFARFRIVAAETVPASDDLVRAQRLLDSGRYYGAYRLVRSLDQGSERTRLAIERAALERMHVTEWQNVWEPLLRRMADAE